MKQAIVRVFDVLEQAQQARQALLTQGFSTDDVDMSVASDEAGAVKGNFTVGNSPVESDTHTYDSNYAGAQVAGHCIMTVAAIDAVAADRAAAILGQFGAREVGAPPS